MEPDTATVTMTLESPMAAGRAARLMALRQSSGRSFGAVGSTELQPASPVVSTSTRGQKGFKGRADGLNQRGVDGATGLSNMLPR